MKILAQGRRGAETVYHGKRLEGSMHPAPVFQTQDLTKSQLSRIIST